MKEIVQFGVIAAILLVLIVTVMRGLMMRSKSKDTAQEEQELREATERMGLASVADQITLDAIIEKIRADENHAISDADLDWIVNQIKQGAMRPDTNTRTNSLHYSMVTAALERVQLTQAQKDRLLPIVREKFSVPDDAPGGPISYWFGDSPSMLVKVYSLNLMADVKEDRFIPDALPCLRHRHRYVRRAARYYLRTVGYKAAR